MVEKNETENEKSNKRKKIDFFFFLASFFSFYGQPTNHFPPLTNL